MLFGAIDGELKDGNMAQCDIIILALYPRAIVEFLRKKAHFFPRSAIVVDCGGLKREICREGRALAQEHGFTFIGGHPMAGREVWGFNASLQNLFSGASMILTPDGDVDISVLDRVKGFFLSLGFGCVTIKTAEEHDKIIAYTSQLAHVLSSAYIKSPTAEQHSGLSAGSFRDMTRVATINDSMWSEIFIANRDFLIGEIDTLIDNLSAYRSAVAQGDGETLRRLLAEGSERKKKCFPK